MTEDAPSKTISIVYTNWRNKTRERRITPTGNMRFEKNEYHRPEQWLIEAVDEEDGKTRWFALNGMTRDGCERCRQMNQYDLCNEIGDLSCALSDIEMHVLHPDECARKITPQEAVRDALATLEEARQQGIECNEAETREMEKLSGTNL
jgi:hypothetical protein